MSMDTCTLKAFHALYVIHIPWDTKFEYKRGTMARKDNLSTSHQYILMPNLEYVVNSNSTWKTGALNGVERKYFNGKMLHFTPLMRKEKPYEHALMEQVKDIHKSLIENAAVQLGYQMSIISVENALVLLQKWTEDNNLDWTNDACGAINVWSKALAQHSIMEFTQWMIKSGHGSVNMTYRNRVLNEAKDIVEVPSVEYMKTMLSNDSNRSVNPMEETELTELLSEEGTFMCLVLSMEPLPLVLAVKREQSWYLIKVDTQVRVATIVDTNEKMQHSIVTELLKRIIDQTVRQTVDTTIEMYRNTKIWVITYLEHLAKSLLEPTPLSDTVEAQRFSKRLKTGKMPLCQVQGHK
jgi:hypothetical protein